MTRRRFIQTGGVALAGIGLGPSWGFGRDPRGRPPRVVEILMRSDPSGSKVWFDPAGVFIEPGDTVRWLVRENVHTTAAYHPRNGHHSLRIPEGAEPWDSGYLVNPGSHFAVQLTVPGVYDFYCMPHEAAGMVGRIVVGQPAGPGMLPFDYFDGQPRAKEWLPVPDAARHTFPSIDRILHEKVVHRIP